LAVADTVEAMSHARPYRPAIGVDAALREVENGKGKLFDVEVVDACLKLFREDRYDFPVI
jgi:HD-GYP domain-containing protein (c-di-GMP phosphodiesterase class II)